MNDSVNISLLDIIRFFTGYKEKPVLGYGIPPKLKVFHVAERDTFIPTSNIVFDSCTTQDLRTPEKFNTF